MVKVSTMKVYVKAHYSMGLYHAYHVCVLCHFVQSYMYMCVVSVQVSVAVEHEKLRGGGGQLQVQQVGLSW